MMQITPLKYVIAKNFSFKNSRWRTVAILKIEKSHYLMMMQNGSHQCNRHLRGRGIKIFDSHCIEHFYTFLRKITSILSKSITSVSTW